MSRTPTVCRWVRLFRARLLPPRRSSAPIQAAPTMSARPMSSATYERAAAPATPSADTTARRGAKPSLPRRRWDSGEAVLPQARRLVPWKFGRYSSRYVWHSTCPFCGRRLYARKGIAMGCGGRGPGKNSAAQPADRLWAMLRADGKGLLETAASTIPAHSHVGVTRHAPASRTHETR